MKKTLSIVLIITMLLTMAVTAIPVGAAEEGGGQVEISDLGITEPSKTAVTGNAVVPEGGWDAYKAKLVEEGYIPLNTQDTTAISSNGKYYLTGDFNWSSAHYLAAPENIVIDGCGHTITVGGSYLMQNTNGITLRNLTVSRDSFFGIIGGNPNQQSIFGGNGATGATVVENVTLNLKCDVTGTKNATAGVLTSALVAGSRINNVICNVEINVSGTAAQRVGALVGAVTGTGVTISNVLTTGTITVASGAKLVSGGAVGGIVGAATQAVAFENCFNEVAISVANGADFTGSGQVGGIIGNAAGGTTFKNCVNSGSITIGAGTGTAFNPNISNVGGIVPAIATTDVENDDKYTFNTCFNNGDIHIKSDVQEAAMTSGSGGKWAIGGITGRFSGLTEFYHCVNTGAVKCEGKMFRYLGGLAGKTVAGDKVVFRGCVNSGEVELGANADSLGVGGIMGSVDNPSADFEYCYNKGNITTNATHSVASGVAGIVGHLVGGNATTPKTADIQYCENSGEIKGLGSNNNLFTGGIIGYVTGGNYVPHLSYCVNSGELSGGKRSAGIIGCIQTTGTPAAYQPTIAYCVNNGNVTATGESTHAAGVIAFTAADNASIATATVTITSCVNKGTVQGDSTEGGIAASLSDKNANLSYIIEDCVSFDSCISASTPPNTNDSAIRRCIVAGTATIAPAGFTRTDSKAYTDKNDPELKTDLNNKAGVLPTYDRDNITALYNTAAKITNSSVYDDATAFEEARADAKNCLAFAVDNANYFLKQSETNTKYQTLYDIMYTNDPATYSVYIPEDIKLDEETYVSAEVSKFTAVSKHLSVEVSGDFKLYHMSGDNAAFIKYYLESDSGNVEADDTLIEITGNGTENYTFTARADADEEASNAVYPGKYSGTLTFTVVYEQQ